MAIINIPSSWSPIAAGIDVFVQDRLARQKRERQAEQDAWNREARARQRQNWGHIDQERAYQQQQRNQALADKQAQEALTQGYKDAYTDNDARIAYTGIRPETGYGTGLDELAGAGEDERAATFGEHQESLARTMAMYPGAPKPGAAAYNTVLGVDQAAGVTWTDQQIAEGIRALEDPQVSDAMKVQIARQFQAQKITPTIINQVLGPKAAKTVHEAMSVSDPNYMAIANALHDPDAMYTTESGFGVGGESVAEAGGEQGDYSRTQQRYTPQEKLALHQRFYGKPASKTHADAYYKGPKAAKEAQAKPIKSWFKAYDKTVRGDFAGDLVDGPIAAGMKAALLAAGGGDAGKVDLTTLVDEDGNNKWFSHADQQQLMSNLWEAAQLIQRQYVPGQSVEMIFEDMYRNIGFGDEKLDVVDISESISPFVKGSGLGPDALWNDTEATFSKTPSIFNAQQMIQDYIRSKGGVEHIVTERNI